MSDNTTTTTDGTESAATPPRRKMMIGVLGVPAVGAVAVGTLIVTSGDGDDAISTADAPTTTVAPTTTESSQVFSAADTAPPITIEPVAPTTTVAAATTTTTVPATTTPSTIVPFSVPETLPETPSEPIAPPADPRGAEDQIQIGGISIPSLGVEAPLLEGIRLTTLDNGPGHWPGTAMPGEVGNVVVAAHRTSHGGPFRDIDQLVTGDLVQFNTADGVVDYTVTGTQIVEPDALWIVDPTDTATATLFACHPPGSVAQRIVVNLELA